MGWKEVFLVVLGASVIEGSLTKTTETLQPGQNFEPYCNTKAREAVAVDDCVTAISMFETRFPEGRGHVWRWTHDAVAKEPLHILAPNATVYNTCGFVVDFDGAEYEPGTYYSTQRLAAIGMDILSVCIRQQGKEGGRSYAIVGGVLFFVDVGIPPPMLPNIKYTSDTSG